MIRIVGLLLWLVGSDALDLDPPFEQCRRRSLAELAVQSVGDAVGIGGFCGAVRGERRRRRNDLV